MLGAILTAVPAVEAFGKAFNRTTGDEKRATVLELVQAELSAAELLAGRDLANDRDVLAAAGAVTDAVVAFHTVLAKKAAAPDGVF